jgi:hypothetical protein
VLVSGCVDRRGLVRGDLGGRGEDGSDVDVVRGGEGEFGGYAG